MLERLTDAILYEELTDDTAHKSRQYEYPFLSAIQIARREEGIHQRKNEGGQRQVKLTEAGYMATDGRYYGTPRRRELSDNEKMFLDSAVKSRNVERRRKYDDFTGVQPVTTYTLSQEEMEARGWR